MHTARLVVSPPLPARLLLAGLLLWLQGAVARLDGAEQVGDGDVAEALDLPFSTYRRHLNRGLDELCGLLWKAENHGLRLLTRAGPLH